MIQIELEKILQERFNYDIANKSFFVRKVLFAVLKKILYIEPINRLLQEVSHLAPKHLINEVFDKLNFSYLISDVDLQKIPAEGRLICVSNHPIGSLDSLALLKAFLEVRNDVKVVANDVLLNFKSLAAHLLPFKLDSQNFQRSNIEAIGKALENESAVIIFPAGTVSRLDWFRVMDLSWNKGAVHFAQKFNTPILPMFINAKNSFVFYTVSVISKRLSALLLAHELFNKKNKTIRIKIGDMIPSRVFASSFINSAYQTKLLKRHVYKLGKNRKGIYLTEKNVIHPVDSRIIKRELNNANLLGILKDNMKIYLTTQNESPHTLNEIARLREITFRRVGEGTGKKLDLDKYDNYYSHIVVWDDNQLEIVGSYRLGTGSTIASKLGQNGFYTSSLFNYSKEFVDEYLPYSIELGRSFVQKKYWNTNALNILWQGIGAYLNYNQSVKYLFGGVSISNSYPDFARELIIYYFDKWFGDNSSLISSKRKYVIPEKERIELQKIFSASNSKDDYKILKSMLRPTGFSVPILYKHYSELCLDGGVKFLDFGTDPEFENCIDGLILVSVDLIKEEKKRKYIKPSYESAMRATG
ncbi:MAG: lysophospholipid acyltransferase family protein [bacterium]